MSEKQRVLVYGMSDNPGGIETYLRNLTKELAPEIVLDFVTDFPGVAYEEELKSYGSRIYYIGAKSQGLLKQWKKFRKLLREHPEYQTVYGNILNAGAVFTLIIPWIHRRKLVIHSHNGAADNERLHKICRPFLNGIAKQFVACSKLAGSFMFGQRIMEHKDVLIMPNAIEAETYAYDPIVREEVRQELGIKENFVICHVGRIAHQKNPKGVIDIFSSCLEEEKDCVLLYVGTGELEQEIKNYAAQKRVADKVKFLGVRKDVRRLMQAADCFLLPSFYEGLPIVAVEAQAAGLPCFLSDQISEETKLSDLVEFLKLGDTRLWRNAILESRGKERKSRLQEIICAGYDLNHQEKKIEQLKKKF